MKESDLLGTLGPLLDRKIWRGTRETFSNRSCSSKRCMKFCKDFTPKMDQLQGSWPISFWILRYIARCSTSKAWFCTASVDWAVILSGSGCAGCLKTLQSSLETLSKLQTSQKGSLTLWLSNFLGIKALEPSKELRCMKLSGTCPQPSGCFHW